MDLSMWTKDVITYLRLLALRINSLFFVPPSQPKKKKKKILEMHALRKHKKKEEFHLYF